MAFFGLLGLLAASRVYYKANSGKELIEQQGQAIAALKATVSEQDRRIVTLTATNEHMLKELDALRETVTQAAKVDDLTALVRIGFEQLGVKIK